MKFVNCRGDFAVEYAGELIEHSTAEERENKYAMDESKGCYMYFFKTKGKHYCIDATVETGRYGRLVNHSLQTPNLMTKVIMNGKIPRLILVAKHDIEPGTELLYDYGDRSKESLAAHPWLAKYIGGPQKRSRRRVNYAALHSGYLDN